MRTLLLLAVAVSMMGCHGMMHMGSSGKKGSGHLVKKTLSVGSYKSIASESVGNLTVTVGGKASVVVETDDNILPLLTSKVEDGVLTLSAKENIDPTKLRYTITTPTLEGLAVRGVGNADIKGVTGPSFKAEVEGVGNLNIEGAVDKFVAEVRGVGNLNAFDLDAKSVTVKAEGVGNANVNAINKLDATVAGVGDVRYKGNPQVTKKVDGVGSIQKSS